MTTTVPSFIAALTVESHHHSLFTEEERSFRMFKGVPCKDGKHSLSIQASFGHYCEPNVTLEDLGAYSRWELALVGPDGLVVPDESDPVFGPFADLWWGDSVAGYVPTERVEAMYRAACC